MSRFTQQGETQTTVGDAGPASGKQVITIGSDTFTVLVIGTACYFQGDARQMVEQLGLSAGAATAHAGQWISLAPNDPPYQSVYVAVTTRSALNSNIAFAPHQETRTVTRSGYRVLGVTGSMTNQIENGQTQRAKGTASLYVTVSHPHLPVLLHRERQDQQRHQPTGDDLQPLGGGRRRDRPQGCGQLLLAGYGQRHAAHHGPARSDVAAPPFT